MSKNKYKPEPESLEASWAELSRLLNKFIDELIEASGIEKLIDWLMNKE